MSKRALVLFTFATLLSTPALPQGLQGGSVEIGGYAGYGFPDDYVLARPDDGWLFGGRVGVFLTPNVSFEPSFQALLTDTSGGAGFHIYSTRFNILYNFLPDGSLVPFVTGGLGWERLTIDASGVPSGTSDDLGFNAGAGLRWFFAKNFAARIDGRFVFTEVGGAVNENEYNFEGTLGLSYVFGMKPPVDTDGDGVFDRKDACPNTPKGATVDAKGCPTDSDGDGVFDGIDTCAGTTKGAKVDEKGCPLDTDADGVFDGIDACPETPAGAKVDANGCPLDADADGVADGIDTCPETPKGTQVDSVGCPVVDDADADGVKDPADKCPNTPAGTKVDSTGCPLIERTRGVLKGVNFEFGKAAIKPESFKVLEETGLALQEFPEVQVEVQGHTDAVGSEEANLKMSQARAEAVVDYLVSKGVARNRLHAKGYGPAKPVADNKTKAGRAKNRRVELLWLDAAPKTE